MGEWIRIWEDAAAARAAMHPGKPQLMLVSGRKVCVGLHAGRFFAIADRCPHNGESLSKGRINAFGEVVCPWHGYRYPMDGGPCPSGGPAAENFPVREDDNGIFIAL